MSYWREVGISYLRYANLISGSLRRSLKPDVAARMAGRGRNPLVVDKYKDGVPERGKI